MKSVPSLAFDAYQKYRAFAKRNKTYKVGKNLLAAVVAIYGLILVFPQFLFAHEAQYRTFRVYSRQPQDESLYQVLDSAEARLEKSPLYDKNLAEKIFISDSCWQTSLSPSGSKMRKAKTSH